jgi:hypothetical protein
MLPAMDIRFDLNGVAFVWNVHKAQTQHSQA